uniref:Uncharacterized protein n=1 Tax=uncultured marine virus TaxID=186617 RepID=A0A0F7L2Y1_9VIRU|nr:hypothetical protein [uncultured marine virus]
MLGLRVCCPASAEPATRRSAQPTRTRSRPRTSIARKSMKRPGRSWSGSAKSGTRPTHAPPERSRMNSTLA